MENRYQGEQLRGRTKTRGTKEGGQGGIKNKLKSYQVTMAKISIPVTYVL